MGLLNVLKKIKRKERQMRLLLLGLDNAGKTTIVKKFCGEDTSTISPTLGFNIKTLQHKSYHLNVWDIGGQQTIRSYWRNYFEKTDVIIWVVDSADQRRLEMCRDELHKLLKHERLAGATLLIFANKQDIAQALSLKEISDVLSLSEETVGPRNWRIQRCSAVTGQGLLAGIDWAVDDVSARIFQF
eukprot:g31988.t1